MLTKVTNAVSIKSHYTNTQLTALTVLSVYVLSLHVSDFSVTV